MDDYPQTDDFTLVDLLLAEQQMLTPVERFARIHKMAHVPEAPKYRDLIPLSRPGPGEQYAFLVDLDRCSGCKACVSACHSLNGLEEGEMWRSVGLLIGERAGSSPYLQTITTACHHCVEPACAHGCPVLAYEKDAGTGIVRHLDDQCIGCQYCILKCPYDVPKYSKQKGIVRKCDMCHGRLAGGEAPACVQACPHEAIRIDVVNQEVARASALAPDESVIPGSCDSRYTIPTTRYHSTKPIPRNAQPADAMALRLEQPHWPLAGMLLLTQLAAGLHLLNLVVHNLLLSKALSLTGAGLVSSGLALSTLHLGRPLKAWRAFLGWRRSWMSREIIAFAIYASSAGGLFFLPNRALPADITAAAGLVAVFCSAMIYIDTHRRGWTSPFVLTNFFGTALLLGSTVGAFFSSWLAPEYAVRLGAIATIIRTILFGWEALSFWQGARNPASALHRSVWTALTLARPVLIARISLFVAATVFSLLAIFASPPLSLISAAMACMATLTSQILERWLFFTTVSSTGMPGGVPA